VTPYCLKSPQFPVSRRLSSLESPAPRGASHSKVSISLLDPKTSFEIILRADGSSAESAQSDGNSMQQESCNCSQMGAIDDYPITTSAVRTCHHVALTITTTGEAMCVTATQNWRLDHAAVETGVVLASLYNAKGIHSPANCLHRQSPLRLHEFSERLFFVERALFLQNFFNRSDHESANCPHAHLFCFGRHRFICVSAIQSVGQVTSDFA